MKKLLLALSALVMPFTAVNAEHRWHNQYHHHDRNFNQFRLFVYNYNPTYVGSIWLGYDGIYRCTRPEFGTVGVLTDDWGRVMTRFNFYGTPRYRFRCR